MGRSQHRAQVGMVAYCKRLKLLSSPAGTLCPWDHVLRPNTFSLSLQQIHEAEGLKPFRTEAAKEGRGGNGRKKISFWLHDSLEMKPEEINFLHSLTVISCYAERLNFWILLITPLFTLEISNAVLTCIQVLKVTPGLLVNLHMLPQIKIFSFIREYWQIHRVQSREGRESGKLDFLGESR